MEASAAFQALGPQALHAVPELIRIYNRNPSAQYEVIEALKGIGPTAIAAAPVLISATTNAYFPTRLSAISTLGQMKLPADVIVPALVRCLDDPQDVIRYFAVCDLVRLGPQAKPALPRLVELRRTLPRQSPPGTFAIAETLDSSLKDIDPDAPRYEWPP